MWIKDGVRLSARGVEADGGLRTEEKVWVRILMLTYWIIHVPLQNGTPARTLLGSQPGKSPPVSPAGCTIVGCVWVYLLPWNVSFSEEDIGQSLSFSPTPSLHLQQSLHQPRNPTSKATSLRGLNWSSIVQINEFLPEGCSAELCRLRCCISAPRKEKLPEGRTLSS